MKELSIEEKAKAYDNALEIAKGLYAKDAPDSLHLERMFPQLTENEDERIRKELIENLRELSKMYDTLQTEREYSKVQSWIAWLKKQGEQDPYNGVSFKYNGHTWGMCARDNGVDILLDRQLIKHLEKQGEQKQDPCDNCKDVMLNCHNFPCVRKRAFKQGKSVFDIIKEEKVDNANKVEPKDYSSIDPHFGKPVDKVKPKFKVGDWVVLTAGELSNTLQIVNVDTNKKLYWFNDSSYLPIADEECLHLWTIKDAKDGDVIYSKHNTEDFEWIGIFKSLDEGVHFYGFWNNVTKAFKVCNNEIFVLYDDFSPATKEQRDQLEKAITEAGYEWYAEKKELKKIEDEIEIPYGSKDSELQEATYYIPKGFHAEIDDDKVVIKKGEKPTWSEEDEMHIRELESLVKQVWATAEHENDKNTIHKMSDLSFFLKTLKPQLKQEWSEDDKKTLERVIRCIENHDYMNVDDIHWLKSLKDRVGCEANYIITKWSKEDDKMLHTIIADFKGFIHNNTSTLESHFNECIDWLKSLKDRCAWKPSDEQMDALQYVYRNLNPPLTDKLGWNSIKTLELMCQDLNKLREE